MKHLVIVAGASTGGKTTHADGMRLHLRSHGIHVARESFAAYLKEEAVRRGWNGKKDTKGRMFLQELQYTLKHDYGDDIFARKMLENAMTDFNTGNDVVIVDDHRFMVERNFLSTLNPKKIKVTFVKFYDAQAETRWRKAFKALEPWAIHVSELEWRAFPDEAWDVIYHNDRTLGVTNSVVQFTNAINLVASFERKRK